MGANEAPRGIYCKRIPFTELVRLIRHTVAGAYAGLPPWDASDPMFWENNPQVAIADGVLMGKCRFWLGTGQLDLSVPRAGVTPFESTYTTSNVADPAPTEHAGCYAMLFSAISLGGVWEDGQGIWRASFIDTGVDLEEQDGTITASVFGLDFLSLPARGSTIPLLAPSDRIASSTTDTEFLDPNPERMADGTYRVQAGAGTYLALFIGGDTDMCAEWETRLNSSWLFAPPGLIVATADTTLVIPWLAWP